MVLEAIFIVKLITRGFKKSIKVSLKCSYHLTGCQIVNIDVLLDRSIQYFCNEVLFYDSGN